MFHPIRKHGTSLLVLLAVAAIALSGCSSKSKILEPGATGAQNGATPVVPAGTDNAANGNGSGLTGANAAFGAINSYKFSMTLAGGTWGSLLSGLGGGASSGGAMTVAGTVTVKPESTSDVTMAGMHIITVGGYNYTDIGMGSFIKAKSSGSSIADSFSPSKMFSNYLPGSGDAGYSKVATESKNGVDCDHFAAAESALTGFSSLAANATWTQDIWIAKTGGYPVSMALVGKSSDGKVAFEILFDITNVNDPANTVTAPTNVMGS
jgi:hypothetical protein